MKNTRKWQEDDGLVSWVQTMFNRVGKLTADISLEPRGSTAKESCGEASREAWAQAEELENAAVTLRRLSIPWRHKHEEALQVLEEPTWH